MSFIPRLVNAVIDRYVPMTYNCSSSDPRRQSRRTLCIFESTTGRFDPAAASRIRFFNAIAQPPPPPPSDDLLVPSAIKTSSLSRALRNAVRRPCYDIGICCNYHYFWYLSWRSLAPDDSVDCFVIKINYEFFTRIRTDWRRQLIIILVRNGGHYDIIV